MGILTEGAGPKQAGPAAPALNGLILCGGKSRRMQEDKSLLNYRDVPHWQYTRHLINPFVADTWISCRNEQAGQFGTEINLLFDQETFGMKGPAGGMLAALERFPDHAWLVIACDLPLITAHSLDKLVRSRDPQAPATAFLNPEKNWPEPLLTIWEPAGLRILATNADKGHYSPRKVLEESRPALISFPDPAELFNANTPADRDQARRRLGSKQ